jgi:hypothetical protein
MPRRGFVIAAVVLLAIVLRGCAVLRLPVDFDEPVYFEAGQRLAGALRAGDLAALSDADSAPEHPALGKLVYAAVFLLSPPPEAASDALTPLDYPGIDLLPPRATAAFLGVLHVILLAVVSPAAGLLLAIHTYAIKYTAQVYLEALPMLTATICVLAYMVAHDAHAKDAEERKDAKTPGRKEETPSFFAPSRLSAFAFPLPSRSWRSLREPLFLSLSAIALGLTAAGKYIYVVAGLAVAVDALWMIVAARQWRGLWRLAAWGALALLVFVLANPNLWPDPIGRLLASLRFHAAYSQGEHVAASGYPWYQPFIWLFVPMPVSWHPFALITPLDWATAALGVLGLWPAWRAWGGRGRVVVMWWGIGLLFTLLWATKWPQYSLVMTAPMCLCAAQGWRQIRALMVRSLVT